MDIRLVEQVQELFEIVNSWLYTPAKDKEKLIYDFYLLNALPTPKDDNLRFTLEESRKRLYNYLKIYILHTIKYIVARELIHSFDFNLENKVKELFTKYSISYQEVGNDWKLKVKEDLDLILCAKEAFNTFNWYPAFGGKRWVKICDAWLELNNQENKSLGVLAADIDYIFDIEHNTGLLFNKLKGFDFLKDLLDFKRVAKYEYDLFEKVSPELKTFSAAILKDVYNTTYEEWLKNPKATQQNFYKQNEVVEIVDRRYIYNHIPKYVDNIDSKICSNPRLNEGVILNNFKYTPLFSFYRLYLIETKNKERILVDSRGLK